MKIFGRTIAKSKIIVENLDDKLKADKTFKLQDRIYFKGLDIAIENKKGSIRRGVDDDGTKWETFMHIPYGYVRQTESVSDGEKIDCYIGDNRESEKVFIVDQNNPFTGKFDEQKCMLGFDTAEEAKKAYLKQYDNPKFFGSMKEMTFEEFKKKALATVEKPKLLKAFGKILKAFGTQLGMFSDEAVEGQTRQKDGHTYEVRRSKKNPLVKRLFRADKEEEAKPKELSLFDKKVRVGSRQPAVSSRRDKVESKKGEQESTIKNKITIKKNEDDLFNQPEEPIKEEKKEEKKEPKAEIKVVKGKKNRKEINAKVEELLKTKKNDEMSAEDVELLAQYTGRGGLLGDTLEDISLNEFYTRKDEAEFIWDMIGKLGFKGGNVLEPSMGTGIFVETAPEKALVTGIEIEETSGRIGQILHGNEHDIRIQSFEQFIKDYENMGADLEGGEYDAIVGNCPFGKRGLSAMDDRAKSDIKFHEQYFIDRGLDMLKPGGIMAMIVPTSIMDNQLNQWRGEVNRKGEFLGAIRVPTGAFKHTDAQVTTDIVFFKKRPPEVIEHLNNLSKEELGKAFDDMVMDADFVAGNFFKNNPEYALGTETNGMFGMKIWKGDVTKADLEKVGELLNHDARDYSSLGIDVSKYGELEKELEPGDVKNLNGRTYILNKNHRWERLKDQEIVLQNLPEDIKKLGITSWDEWRIKSEDIGYLYGLNKDQLKLFGQTRIVNELEGYHGKNDFQDEYLTKGVVLGLAVKDFRKALQDGRLSAEEAQMQAAKLKVLLKDFVEKYGHPIENLKLNKFFKNSGNAPLLDLAGSYDKNGNTIKMFDDPLSFYKVYQTKSEIGTVDRNDIVSVIGFLFANNFPTDYQTIRGEYEGDGDIERELAYSDEIYFDEEGNYKPKEEVLYGYIYEKIDAWEKQREKLKKEGKNDKLSDKEKELNAQKMRKLEDQIIEAKTRANIREIKQLPIMLSDAGSIYGIGILNKYLEEKIGAHFLGELRKDEKSGFILPVDDSSAKLYLSYADITKEGKSTEVKKELRDLFNKDEHPLLFMILNKMNGLGLPALRTEEGIAKKEQVLQLETDFKQYLSDSEDADKIADKYNRLFNSYIQKTYDEKPIEGIKHFAYDRVVGKDGTGREISGRDKAGGHTWATVRRMYESGKGMIAHGVGLGKAQPLDALILTPNGFIKMGDVIVGQEIINSQGEVSRITGIYPQGELDAYEVEFNDGSKVVCNDEHLWAVRTFGQQRRGDPFHVKTLKEIMPKINMKGKHKRCNYRIPMIKAIKFPPKDVLIDPYLLGLLLGDGSISNEVDIIIGKADQDIVNYCKDIAPKYNTVFESRPERETHYKFKRINAKVENKLRVALRFYKLMGEKADSKFIPIDFLLNDIETRLSVLQGLIDTDGFLGKDGVIQYTTVSKQLKDDIKFIVNSLGGTTIEHCKQGKYFNGKNYVICKIAYTLNISIPPQFVCIRSQRKLLRFKPRNIYKPNRLIKSVKHIGKAEMQCIMVDSPDHLYVTDNMVLTHNTLEALTLTLLSKETGRAHKPCIVSPKSVLLNWVAEIEKWTQGVNYLLVGYKKDATGAWVEESREEKELKLQRAANEDFDIILMSRDLFGTIDFSPETKKNMLNELMDKYYPEGNRLSTFSDQDSKYAKNVKKKRDTLLRNLSTMMDIPDPLGGVYLDNIGIDMLVRDEAHDTKNLLVPMENEISGVNSSTSQRAMHNLFASKIIRGQNNDMGYFGLTATPISNSPLEVFNMMVPFAEKELEKLQVQNMDDFVDRFADIDNIPTTNADGRVIVKNKFSGWKSAEALRNTFFRFVDYKTKDDVESVKANIKFPKEKAANVLSDLNEGQKEIVKHCKLRLWMLSSRVYDKDNKTWDFNADKLQEKVGEGLISQDEAAEVLNYFNDEYLPKYIELNKGISPDDTPMDDHFFKVQQDLIKATSDLPWYQEKCSEFSKKVDSALVKQHSDLKKFAQLNENALSIHKSGGKQIIFAINTALHDKIKNDLIKSGIPENEIVIVNGKTVSSSSKRLQISKAYNDGKYKVVIGNYATMGEGLNFNYMTSDIHHLQPAWNHLQIEQGNGRGIRQGNPLDSVNTHYYLTKGSIDGFMNTKIMDKAGMVDKFLKGETSRWDDEVQLEADEMMIELADNPEQAKALLAFRNKKLQDALAEQQRQSNYKQYDRLYEVKRKKAGMEDKTSKQYQMMEQEERSLTEKLIGADFEHKGKLDYDRTPVILPGINKVIPIGSILGGKDGEFYAVEDYAPSTQRVKIRTYKTRAYGDAVATRSVSAKELDKEFNALYKETELDMGGMFNKLIEDNDEIGLNFIAKIPKEILQANKVKLLEKLNNSDEVMYQTMDGDFKVADYEDAKSEITTEGGKIIFPQEKPEFPKILNELIKQNRPKQQWGQEYSRFRRFKNLAVSIYGENYENAIKKEIKRLNGEATETSFAIHTTGAQYKKELKHLFEKGYMSDYTYKQIMQGKAWYEQSSYSNALRAEFFDNYHIKEENGEYRFNPSLITAEALDRARAIDEIKSDDNKDLLEDILTNKLRGEAA